MIRMKCKICGNKLIKLMQYENMPSGAQFIPAEEALASDKAISLPISECSGCGLVQIPVPPVDYYKEAVRSPAWLRAEWRKKQLSDFKEEFNLLGKRIVTINNEPEPSSYDAFLMFNYLEHFPDPKKILLQIRDNLPPDGVGIIDVPNFEMIAKERVFSELVVDHLFYFTKPTLTITLLSSGFEVLRMNELLDGYILSATVRKRQPIDFVDAFKEQENKLINDIQNYIDNFSSIAIWGAGHQTFFLLSLMKDLSKISYIIDSFRRKQGKYTPVTHIPIMAPNILKSKPVEAILIMVGGFYYEVPDQIKSLGLDYLPSLAVIKKTELEIL
jgi:SAM-dependent methyltransferase